VNQQQGNPQAAPKKRKKKNATAAVQGQEIVASASGQFMVPQQFVHSAPVIPVPEVPVTQPLVPVAPAISGTAVASGKAKKGVRCWKCAVNTHSSKDYKVVHY
jgi:hypothetical protein